MKIAAVSLIRNEVDIINSTLTQSRVLFDSHSIIDMVSTDGTRELLESESSKSQNLSISTFRINAKYQSEIGNEFVRQQVAAGADWVFLLDADEFLRVESRQNLEQILQDFRGSVMNLPWINLIPEKFGEYDSFQLDQAFRWTGRVSPFRKIALSARFVHENPGFEITMGNHNVVPSGWGTGVEEKLGIPILHLPIRSLDRLAYKANRERIVLKNKANNNQADGQHLEIIDSLLAKEECSASQLRALAKDYGSKFDIEEISDSVMNALPAISLPNYLLESKVRHDAPPVSLSEVITRDAQVKWTKHKVARGSKLQAVINSSEVLLKCQPVRGDGSLIKEMFKKLPPSVDIDFDEINAIQFGAEVLSAALVPPKVYEFSAWSELVPVLSAILSICKPRRYVELGVHNGMSFFGACHTSEKLNLSLECIAVDSWAGDEHAGFHTADVFENFKRNLRQNFADQIYIQGYFEDAKECFEDGSVDLLHIDGFHTYEAVKQDFDNWLSRMSDCGVIIFHDINVHRKDFGVWRFWNEVSARFPSFGFQHSHGLGIIYVGSVENPIKNILSWLTEEKDFAEITQAAFTGVGELLIEARRIKFELDMQSKHVEKLTRELAQQKESLNAMHSNQMATGGESIVNDKWWRRTRPFRKLSNRIRKVRGKPQKSWPDLSPKIN